MPRCWRPALRAATPAFDAFIKEVAREMTVKAGQKCTAIRRVFVPARQANAVTDALAARLGKVTVGDPRNEKTRMGPLVTRAQQDAAFDGIRRLASEADFVTGSLNPPTLDGIDRGQICLRRADAAQGRGRRRATRCTTPKCSGPAPRSFPTETRPRPSRWSRAAAARWSPPSIGEDRDFLARAAVELGASNGRILAIEPSIADVHTGHGIVMPQCHHGGPGRAGNGAELGGLYGLWLYLQRVAVQGSSDLLDKLQAPTAPAH